MKRVLIGGLCLLCAACADPRQDQNYKDLVAFNQRKMEQCRTEFNGVIQSSMREYYGTGGRAVYEQFDGCILPPCPPTTEVEKQKVIRLPTQKEA